MPTWTRSRDVSWETTWIIASGPSLTREDCNKIRGCKAIAVNTAYHSAPWVDVLYACDLRWWDWHYSQDEMRFEFQGERWTQDEGARNKYHLKWIRSERNPGLSRDGRLIHQGANGGYQACNLAYHWGARRIRLLGFDMKAGPGGKKHFHGDHPSPMNANLPFGTWIANFQVLAKDLKSEGVEVINCTRDTDLRCFPIVPLEEVLDAEGNSTNT